MRSILAAVIVLSLTGVVCAEPSLTGTASELANYLSAVPQSVAVTGKAEIKVAADRAVLTLKVITEDKTLTGALKKNQGIRNDVKTSLEKGGIAADRIKGSRFSSTPNYGLWSDKVRSYKVENIITVKVSDEGEFQLVAAELDKHPEMTYLGMTFERSDQTELKQKAIAQACEAAVAKVKLFEEKLGVKLTTVAFSQPTFGVVIAGLENAGGYGNVSNFSKVASSRGESGEEAAVSQFDEMTFTAEVTLTCRLVEVQSEK